MRQASMLVIVLFMGLSLECNAQSQAGSTQNPPTKASQSSPLPAIVGHYRPKISLQDALKIAEDYISKEHIDIRQHWLHSVHYILVGDEKTPTKRSCQHGISCGLVRQEHLAMMLRFSSTWTAKPIEHHQCSS